MAPGTDDPDRKLSLRARRGDGEALAVLYQRHKRQLLGFLRRMIGPSTLAEDVFQDVWMKVMKNIYQYKPDRGPFRAWLYRVAANSAVDRLRVEATRSRWIEDDAPDAEDSILDRQPAFGPDPEQHHLGIEALQGLDRVLMEMAPRQRTAILMRHQLGFTYSEIAETLNVAEGTAKTLVHRGILAVREDLAGKKP